MCEFLIVAVPETMTDALISEAKRSPAPGPADSETRKEVFIACIHRPGFDSCVPNILISEKIQPKKNTPPTTNLSFTVTSATQSCARIRSCCRGLIQRARFSRSWVFTAQRSKARWSEPSGRQQLSHDMHAARNDAGLDGA